MLDNPIVWAMLVCFALGVVLAGIVRIRRWPVLTSLVPPAVFGAAYVLTYQQIPPFPPVGSTNKIFYIWIAAILVGLAVELGPKAAWLARALAVLVPALIVVWIGWPRLSNPDPALAAAMIGLWLGGALVLLQLVDVTAATPETNGGSLVAGAILIALTVGFAPVALLGASSTSLMLCLAAAAGFGAAAIWELVVPRGGFGPVAIFGSAGGLLAVVDTVTLITRQIDPFALALLLLIPYVGPIGARFLLPGRIRGRARQILVGLLAASPILAVAAILLWRHPEAFMS